MSKKKNEIMKEAWENLKSGIDAICAKCGSDAKIYPGGLFCETCSPPEMLDFVKSYNKTNGGYQKL